MTGASLRLGPGNYLLSDYYYPRVRSKRAVWARVRMKAFQLQMSRSFESCHVQSSMKEDKDLHIPEQRHIKYTKVWDNVKQARR